jgi:hypothetical protein
LGKGFLKQAAIELRQALIELDGKERSGEKGEESESKFKSKMEKLGVGTDIILEIHMTNGFTSSLH